MVQGIKDISIHLQNYFKPTGDPRPCYFQNKTKQNKTKWMILPATDCELVPALIPVIFQREINFIMKVSQQYRGD